MTEAQSTRRDVREVLDGDRGRLICRTGAGAGKIWRYWAGRVGE